MISTIFQTISDAIQGLASSLGSAVTSIVSLFWDATANSGAGEFTFLGILTLVGLGAGLVYFALRMIYRAVKGVTR